MSPRRPRSTPDPERAWLEALYGRYHHRRFVDPDPLRVLYRYPDPDDREVAALVAAGLAYGNVVAMLPRIDHVLERLGPSPAETLATLDRRRLAARLRGFRYRFTTGRQLAALLAATGVIRRESGSLGRALLDADDPCGGPDLWPALGVVTDRLRAAAGAPLDHLLADPTRGSACKRLCLMLRWLVREDEVDPGGWPGVDPARLIVPLDTHMHQTALARGWTTRQTANALTARDVTDALRRVCPEDPLRFDFAITRPGIRGDEEASRRAMSAKRRSGTANRTQ